MNSKNWALALGGVALAFSLTACGSSDDNYVPDAMDSDYTALNTAIVAHPGMNCYMYWGNGSYMNNCVPTGYVIPYSVHVYYPRSGYCGCLSVAQRPANYRPVYVNKTTYVKTHTTVVVNNKPAGSAPKPAAPRPAAPAPAAPRSGSGRR